MDIDLKIGVIIINCLYMDLFFFKWCFFVIMVVNVWMIVILLFKISYWFNYYIIYVWYVGNVIFYF